MASLNLNPEVVLRLYGRHLEKSILRHSPSFMTHKMAKINLLTRGRGYNKNCIGLLAYIHGPELIKLIFAVLYVS